MSVSIHHIYSSMTLILSLVSSAALLPSENTQIRTVCCLNWDGRILFEDRPGLLQFTSQADHSVGSKRSKRQKKSVQHFGGRCLLDLLSFQELDEKSDTTLMCRDS